MASFFPTDASHRAAAQEVHGVPRERIWSEKTYPDQTREPGENAAATWVAQGGPSTLKTLLLTDGREPGGQAACLGQPSLPRRPAASLSKLSGTRRPGGLPGPAQPAQAANGQPEQAERHQAACLGQPCLLRRPAASQSKLGVTRRPGGLPWSSESPEPRAQPRAARRPEKGELCRNCTKRRPRFFQQTRLVELWPRNSTASQENALRVRKAYRRQTREPRQPREYAAAA